MFCVKYRETVPNLTIYSDITYLMGVGPKKAETLRKELNIATIKDLLYYFPYKHIDRSQFHKINEIDAEMPYIQIKGRIINFSLHGQKYKERLVAQFADETGSIELLWFKGIKWIQQNLKTNKEYIIFGKPGKFGNKINIIHPEIEEPEQAEKQLSTGLQPVYSVPEKLKKNYITSKVISKLIINALKSLSANIPETLPPYLINQLKFMPLNTAIKQMHFPDNQALLKNATARLKFEELFYIQIHLLKQKLIRKEKFRGFVFEKVGDKFNNFYHNNLPFELTGAQKK